MWMCWRVGGWGGCRGRRRTALIVCTRRAGRIRTGPPMRCGGAGRGGAVTWGPRSTPTVWPPGQAFALRPCDAGHIRRVCGTTVVTAWLWAGGRTPTWTLTGSRSATTTIAVRCRAGLVSRAPRYVGTDTPTSRNPTPPRRLRRSTRRRMMVSYGVVSSPTSPPIQPPRVRNLLVRALRATPRGNKTVQNTRWWNEAHPPGDGGSGRRRDATTRRGPLRGPGRDLTWHGWGRIWLGGGVGMSRSRPLSRLTGWYGWDGRYRTPEASPPISPAASPDPNYATADTKAPAATCASTSTGPADSTKTSKAEPHTTTTDPPDQHLQPPTQLPNPDGRFL